MTSEDQQQIQKFIDLIKEIDVCMMITKSSTGKLTARPMSNAKVEDDGSIWFFTNEYAGVVDQISEENEILIAYASPSKNSYVSLNARANLSDSRSKIDELWTASMNAWFSEGKDDPKILLIHAVPVEAEYWDGSSNKIVVLFNMLKAAVTGSFTGSEHAKIKL